MPEAARVGDLHTCPKVEPGPVPHVGGPILPPGSPDVEIEFLPAARTNDLAFCAAGGPDALNMGSPNVIINNQQAVRKGDTTLHGGVVTVGAPTVEIGIPGDGVKVKVDKSAPAVPAKGEGDGKGDSEGDGKGDTDADESTEGQCVEEGVVARFDLLQTPRMGEPLIFRCTSWDPDTGGSSETPNPDAIAYRQWTIAPADGSEIIPVSENTAMQTEWHVTLGASQRSQRHSFEVAVTLTVRDSQGHESTTTNRVAVIATKKFILRLLAHGQHIFGAWFGHYEFSFAGHMWVAWGVARNGGPVDELEVVGFGPKEGYHTGWYSSKDGEFWEDTKSGKNGVPDVFTDFALSESAWNASKAAKSNFDASTFTVTTHDCTSFAMDIVVAAGMSIGWRWTNQTPMGTYEEIVDDNQSLVYRPTT